MLLNYLCTTYLSWLKWCVHPLPDMGPVPLQHALLFMRAFSEWHIRTYIIALPVGCHRNIQFQSTGGAVYIFDMIRFMVDAGRSLQSTIQHHPSCTFSEFKTDPVWIYSCAVTLKLALCTTHTAVHKRCGMYHYENRVYSTVTATTCHLWV